MKKTDKIYHVTWTTYNSRVSERMKLYKIKSKNDGIFLDDVQEYEISKIISDIVKDISLEVFAYNICHDHIHILIACNPSDLSNII